MVSQRVGVTLLVVLLAACAGEVAEQGTTEPPFVETGDLAEIESRGQLRIIVPRRSLSERPRLTRRLPSVRRTAISHQSTLRNIRPKKTSTRR